VHDAQAAALAAAGADDAVRERVFSGNFNRLFAPRATEGQL
jgi:hypothetical protein